MFINTYKSVTHELFSSILIRFPLQNFEIPVLSGNVNKYQLECIIQRAGNNAYDGHYWSNVRKNRTWYEAQDAN